MKGQRSYDQIHGFLTRQTSQRKGKWFQDLVMFLLKKHGATKAQRYSEFPREKKRVYALPDQDEGIDLMCKTKGTWTAVQCKWRSGEKLEKKYYVKFTEDMNSCRLKKGIMFTNTETTPNYFQPTNPEKMFWITKSWIISVLNQCQENISSKIINVWCAGGLIENYH